MDSTAHRYPPTTPDASQAGRIHPRPQWRRLTISAIVLIVLISLYSLLGFLVLPAYLHAKIPLMLSSRLGLPVMVEHVAFNPFTLTLTITRFDISQPDHIPLVGFDELSANLQLSSLVHRAWTFDEIHLRLPYARVTIGPDGGLNLAALRPSGRDERTDASEALAKKTDESGVVPLIIHALDVSDGVVEFHDFSQPIPYALDIVPITFALRNFRTGDAGDNRFTFSAELEAGERIEWQGELLLDPLQSDGQVQLTGLKVEHLWEYIRSSQAPLIVQDGTLEARGSYHADITARGAQFRLTDADLRLENLIVRAKGTDDPPVILPSVEATSVDVNLVKRLIAIDDLRSRGARLHLQVNPDGTLEVQRLIEASLPPPGQQAPVERPQTASNAQTSNARWTVTLTHLGLDDHAMTIVDRRPSPPARVEVTDVKARVQNLAYPDDTSAPVEISGRINQAGDFSVAGTVHLKPVSANLQIDVTAWPLPPLGTYVQSAANLDVRHGDATVKGQLTYEAGEPASIHFKGDAEISQLKTLDTSLNKDFLNWESLKLEAVDARWPGGPLSVETILATRPYADIIIAKDRTVNVRTILKQSSASPSPERKPHDTELTMPVKIGAIRIQNGSAHFADFSIQPMVDTGIYRLNGTIRGLSSEKGARAKVALNGEVDRSAPVTIAGTINAFGTETFSDLHVSFENVDLTVLSPYARKFAGYAIKDGRLSMDVDYRLMNRRLEANNTVVINQLTLGDKVESPTATSLPVKLVVALLKDQEGRITIRLPIRGDLDNPEFHYGEVLWRAAVNLFRKAVTSPFAWLGKVDDRNLETASVILFEPGEAELSSQSADQLQKLAGSLEHRPELQLEIAGTATPEADRRALQDITLARQLNAVIHEAEQRGEEAVERSRAAAMEALYARTFGNLPRRESDGSVEEERLRAHLLESIEVEEADLRRLAQERAGAVRDYLVKQTPVPDERIVLLNPSLDVNLREGGVPTQLGLSVAE